MSAPRWLQIKRALPAVGLPRCQRVLLVELMERDHPGRSHVATVAALARSCAYSPRSVHRALAALDEAGFIAVCNRRSDRWTLPSGYRVMWDALSAAVAAAKDGARAALVAIMDAARAAAASRRAAWAAFRGGWQARRAVNPLFSRSATVADTTAPQGKEPSLRAPPAADPGLWRALAEAYEGSEAFNRAADALIRAGQAQRRADFAGMGKAPR